MKTGIEIVKEWMTLATRLKRYNEKARLWVILDLLEGIKPSKRLVDDALTWFTENVKDIPEKEIILKEIKKNET